MLIYIKRIKMAEIGALKAKFLHAYANLPEPEQVQVVVVMDEKPYTWDKVNSEISDNTELSNKLLKRLNVLGIL